MIKAHSLHRRTFLSASAALAVLATTRASAATPKIVIHRDPGCGCCTKWAALARKAGYSVTIVDSPNRALLQQRVSLPEALGSCHTALAGGYAFEGHVPIEDVRRVLKERPRIRGLAVPGMPMGSPGMETGDGSRQAYKVMAFDAAGKVSVYRAVSAS
jgi:hypothetical protein